MVTFLQKFHAGSFLVSFLIVLAGQIQFHGLSINGQTVDLSSQTGITAAILLVVTAIVYAVARTTAADTAAAAAAAVVAAAKTPKV